MGKKFLLQFLCVAVFVVSGCTANQNAVYRYRAVKDPSPSILTVDAKQRSILTAYRLLKADGSVNGKSVRAFCSEPSPDVFSIMAQSLSAGGSFGQRADPASIEAAFNLAFSTAEQGATIPRTQTINMLRELMFRTCERYLSGGYDETELSLQAIRDQRLMVSILAIEQLTGAITPRPVVIGGSGSGGAGLSGEAVVRMDNARQRRDETQQAYETAKEAFASVDSPAGSCATNAAKPTADLDADKKAKCDEKKGKLTAAQEERDLALKDYEAIRFAIRTGGVSAATVLMNPNAEGGFDQERAAAVKDVALSVRAIVQNNFSDGIELMMFCFRALHTKAKGSEVSDKNKNENGYGMFVLDETKSDKLKDICKGYFNNLIDYDIKRKYDNYQNLVTEMRESREIMVQSYSILFDNFWTEDRKIRFRNRDELKKFVDWLKTRLAKGEKFWQIASQLLIQILQ